jgi:hypothetical protein
MAGSALVQAIFNERRIEFVAEGFRWTTFTAFPAK